MRLCARLATLQRLRCDSRIRGCRVCGSGHARAWLRWNVAMACSCPIAQHSLRPSNGRSDGTDKSPMLSQMPLRCNEMYGMLRKPRHSPKNVTIERCRRGYSGQLSRVLVSPRLLPFPQQSVDLKNLLLRKRATLVYERRDRKRQGGRTAISFSRSKFVRGESPSLNEPAEAIPNGTTRQRLRSSRQPSSPSPSTTPYAELAAVSIGPSTPIPFPIWLALVLMAAHGRGSSHCLRLVQEDSRSEQRD